MASRHTRRSAILGLALAGCMSAAAQEPLTRSIDPATEREAVRPRIEAYSRVARDLLGESQRRTMNADHLGRMLEDDSRHVLPDGRELDKAAFLAAPA